MEKRGFILIILFLLVIVPLINSKISDDNVDDKVIDKVNIDGQARVIIKFKDSPTFFRSLSIESEKVKIKDDLGKQVKHDFGDRISATVSADDLEKLEKNSNVESVKLVGVRQVFLQDSVPLINANDTWPLKVDGINLTGEGETICILDTGTNFSHADLLNKNLTCVIDCVPGSCIENCSIGDDNGHGTHVAGIVAANGTLKGVAPDANLVSVKVCDSSGSCADDDIRSGIDWCTNNALTYNISVISMSLGSSTLYPTYCDNQDDPSNITNGINTAIANNISVIVATGNDGNTTAIASPACIQNSTSVGMSYDKNVGGLSWGSPTICTDSTTSADKIVCASNRNNITDLFAPGALINSTSRTGGYVEMGGTSMATPHVAGAFALIYQLRRLSEKTISVQEIQDIFNSTGTRINDTSGNLLNYSRIDVLAAIILANDTLPEVTLESPTNASYTNISLTNFTCSQTSNLYGLVNSTFKLWNSTSLIYNETKNVSGTSNQSTYNYSFVTETNYFWNCLAFDINMNSSSADNNFTITYDNTNPSVTVIGPDDAVSYTGTTDVTFQYNISETNLDSCEIIINGVTEGTDNVVNTTNVTNQFTESLSARDYNWSINCEDFAGNSNQTSNRTITVNAAASSGGGSGGGGGGGSSSGGGGGSNVAVQTIVTSEQLEEGVIKSIKKDDKIIFSINNTNHSISLAEINDNSAIITIQSDPMNITLNVNETRKLNLNNDEYYDLEITLNFILNNRTSLTLREINEAIPTRGISGEAINETENNSSIGDIIDGTLFKNIGENKFLADILKVIVVILVVIFVIWLIRKKEKPSFKPKIRIIRSVSSKSL